MSSSEDDNSQQTVYVNFSQDFTSLTVGTQAAYTFYDLNNVDRLQKVHHGEEHGGIALIERLYNSSLAVIVTSANSWKLRLHYLERRRELTKISYYNTILAVKLNRSRIVVCLAESLYIYSLQEAMKGALHIIHGTPANPKGICALATASYKGATYLAYPGSTSIGNINLFDSEHLCEKIEIRAHNSPLAALAFNAEGSLLASASEKGTVIRVFSVIDGTPIHELKRGLFCATIYSLAFNAESTLLACASNTETVHVFRLVKNSALIPHFLRPLDRSFATAKLTDPGIPSVVALTTIDRQCRLLVASTNGFLYVYNVNVENGGECSFWRQHNLVEDVPGSETTVVDPTAPVSGRDQIQATSGSSPHAPTSASDLRLLDKTESPRMNRGLE